MSYRLGYLLLITFNKNSSLEEAERTMSVCKRTSSLFTLQGSVVGEEGRWEGWTLLRPLGELAGLLGEKQY